MNKRWIHGMIVVLTAAMTAATVTAVAVTASETTDYADNIRSEAPCDISAHAGESSGAVPAYGSEKYGIRLHFGAPFDGFRICIPTYMKTGSEVTVSLYRWDENYDKTIRGQALMSERKTNLIDNGTNVFSFAEQPAGEYVVLLSDMKGEVGLWTYKQVYGFTYADGLETLLDVSMDVHFTKTPKTPFFKCKSNNLYNITGSNKAPAEAEIAEDDILKTHEVMPDTWVATDGLGRTLVTNKEVGDPRDGKNVGIFYWTWHVGANAAGEPFNVQEFIEKHPEAKNDYANAGWGDPAATKYFWNQSIYGYYKSEDAWVVRRQAELLANAGIDVIFTDNTNGSFTWRSGYTTVYETFEKAREGAVRTPKVSYIFPFGDTEGGKQQMETIYQDVYLQKRYQNLWFYWDGKPMFMGRTGNFSTSVPIEKEILGYFTTRRNIPSYTHKAAEDYGAWGWLSTAKQAVFYKNASERNRGMAEQTSVGVALNHNYKTGKLTAMNGENVMGRSYTTKGYKTASDAKLYGYCFSEQFENACKTDAKMTFITGWNEWTAGRYDSWENVVNALPDEYCDEYSRDIEPSKGDLKDHYYYLMVNYIRKLKGCRPLPVPSGETTIDIAKGTGQWESVLPYYAAYIGNTDDRDADGYGSLHYTETSGRNDIIGARIARDSEYLYVLVECNANITPCTDDLWMNILLDTDQTNQGWETFDYVINKTKPSATEAVLERFTGNGYQTAVVGKVSYTVDGRSLQVKIPRKLLKLTNEDFIVNFAVTDNVHDEGDTSKFTGDIMNFYISGDVAPGARFKYSYVVASDKPAETDAPETKPQDTKPAVTARETDPLAAPETLVTDAQQTVALTGPVTDAGTEEVTEPVPETTGEPEATEKGTAAPDSTALPEKKSKSKTGWLWILACSAAALGAGFALWKLLPRKRK